VQIIDNRFEITGVTAPVFASAGMLGNDSVLSREQQSSIPIVNSAATLGNSRFITLSLNVQPFAASQLLNEVVPLILDVTSAEGIRSKLTNVPFEVTLGKTGKITLSSEKQKTAWHFKLDVDSQHREITVSFTLNYSGLSIEEALEGANFYEALVKGGALLISARNPVTGGYMPIVRGTVPSGAYKSNAKLVALLEHLQLIEIKTGVSFSFPEDPISVQQANDLAATSTLLTTGHATYQAESWVSLTPIEEAKTVLDSYKDEMPHPMAIHFGNEVRVIFGEHIQLGQVTFFCDRAYVTADDLEELRRQLSDPDIKGTVSVRFTPFEHCPIEARYIKWLPEHEAAELKRLPMYQERPADNHDELSLDPINVNFAVNLLKSWYDEDTEEQQKTWDSLKKSIDEDRLSGRKLFP
jgi:hypothetical protein